MRSTRSRISAATCLLLYQLEQAFNGNPSQLGATVGTMGSPVLWEGGC